MNAICSMAGRGMPHTLGLGIMLVVLAPLSMLHAAEQKAAAPPSQSPKETPSVFSSEPKEPWTANGHVMDGEGKPMEGVEVWVHAGMGSLFRTGLATTDKDGNYKVSFGRGVMMPVDSPNLQIVNITAHKPGWFELNLNRHGAGAGALREVTAADLESYRITADKLVLPDKPRTVNFTMKRVATLRVTLTGTGSFPNLPPHAYRASDTEKPVAGQRVLKDAPLTTWKVWLTGKELPPGCGVLASAETNEQGEVVFEGVPTGMAWYVQADTHMDHKEPVSREFVLDDEKEVHVHLHLNEGQKELSLTTDKMKELLRSNKRFKLVE
jgi:hypothetical protein